VEPSRIRKIAVRRGGKAPAIGEDPVAVEEPLEIRVLGRPLAVVMRTPGDDLDLAAGFLVTEGIVPFEDLGALAPCAAADGSPAENVVNASLVEGSTVDFERHRRNLYVSSSCGMCGKATLDAIEVVSPPIASSMRVPERVLLGLPARCRSGQTVFDATGGLHAACIFDREGALLDLREDVGRHNAVDKVIGARVRTGRFPLEDTVLLVSGRAGFEILQKARVARIPIVAAVGAPSSLAVECASRGAMTLVGFLRDGGYNVYCGAERIVSASVDRLDPPADR
jgi:FdhD protein